MELKEGFSDMENAKVIDAMNSEIGKIVDHYFTNEFRLEYFVIELENKSRRLVHKNDIEGKEGSNVHISKYLDELPVEAKMKEELKNHHRFTIHRNRPVYTEDGHEVGKIEDNIFHADDHISFVAGKHSFLDLFKKLGIQEEHKIIIPYRNIVDINLNYLKINIPKIVLEAQIPNHENVKTQTNYRRLVSDQAKLEFYKVMR